MSKEGKAEIRQNYASKGGVIDFTDCTIGGTIKARNAKVTLHEANDGGIVNFDQTTCINNVELESNSSCTEFATVGGVIAGSGSTIVSNVTQGASAGAATNGTSNSTGIPNSTQTLTQSSSTGNAADRASGSSGIPSATDTPTTESSGESCGGTPGGKNRVMLKSRAKGVTHYVFEPTDKVGDKMKEIGEMLGEESEIHLFHADGTTELDKSKSFLENKIENGGTIVVKAEVLSTTGAYENKTRQTA